MLLTGDLNGLTGIKPDVIDPAGQHVFGQSPLFTTPTIAHRNNLDSEINQSGREVLHLCQALSLCIVNGRFRGDTLERFIYSSALQSSVVDYAITVRQQSPPSRRYLNKCVL